VTMTAAPSGDRKSALVWDIMRVGFGRRVGFLAVFGLLYAILMLLGLDLGASPQQLTFFWPGRGCRVSVVFPHNEIYPLIQQRDSGSSAAIQN
jgi:hypothetical protein